jgi:hypothetical protein
MAMIVLGGLAGMLMLGRMSIPLTAKEPSQLLIRSNVQSTQITVNNKPAFQGRYRKMPLGLRLPKGRHFIVARREGYYSEQVVAEIKSNTVLEDLRIDLKPRAEFVPFGISAKWSTNPSIIVNIDDGYYVVKLAVANGVESPTEILPDLQAGKEYNLKASIADGGARKDVTCRFTPQKTTSGKLQVLLVDFSTEKCLVFDR